MIRPNAPCLAKIVADVLNISEIQVPCLKARGSALVLNAVVARIAADWTLQTSFKSRTRTALRAMWCSSQSICTA